MSSEKSTLEKNDRSYILGLVAVLVVVIILGYAYLEFNSLISSIFNNNLSSNSSSTSLSGLTVEDVLKQIHSAGPPTSIQRKEVSKSFNGQRIKWYFRVNDFSKDGSSIYGDVSSSPYMKVNIPLHYVIEDPLPHPWLVGVPTSMAVNMYRGDIVEVEATLYFRDSNYNDGTYRMHLENPVVLSINPTPVPSPTPDCTGSKLTVSLDQQISIGKWGVKKVKSIREGKLSEEYGIVGVPLGSYTVIKYNLLSGKKYRFTWRAFGEEGMGVVVNEFGLRFAETDPDKNVGFTQMRTFTTGCAGIYYVFLFDAIEAANISLD